MIVDFFPDTTELQTQRTQNKSLARERQHIIREFCQKMQALGEPYDRAWSRHNEADGWQSTLNTRAYVVNYRMSDAPGSARLAVWVSGDGIFSSIFDEVKTDVPFYTRVLESSPRNPGLIGPEEWDRIVVAMKDRLQSNGK